MVGLVKIKNAAGIVRLVKEVNVPIHSGLQYGAQIH
jgi:hypothetical protein